MLGRLFSLIGLSWGNGGLSVDGASESPSYPPAGTILNTFVSIEFLVANGGGSVDVNGTLYASQVCDVYVKADGVGGSYYDWANAFNVSYRPYGYGIASMGGNTYVTINGNNYINGTSSNDYYHDGSGGYYQNSNTTYSSYGDFIFYDSNSGSNTINTPVGSFAYESWSGINYYHDGSGGFYTNFNGYSHANDNDYIGNDGTSGSNSTEVPSGSGNYFTYSGWTSITYYYQTSGNTYLGIQQNPFNAYYGDYIYTYDGYNFYWDGNGGYYY